MASATTWFIVSFTIAEGKIDAFEATVEKMVAGSLKEPGTLAYEFCLSADRTQCRLVEAYVDAAAVLAHLAGPVVQELVPQVLQASAISGFEVYGDPGAEAAKLLEGFGATVFPSWRGFSR